MAYEHVTLSLKSDRLQALREIAGQEDISIGQLVRDAIDRDLRRRENAMRDGRTDERLVAPLRLLLADDFQAAETWAELAQRLAAKSYALREEAGGLILVHLPNEDPLCTASELGFSHRRLAKRFGALFSHAAPTSLVADQMAS